jgi:hypothetical protein
MRKYSVNLVTVILLITLVISVMWGISNSTTEAKNMPHGKQDYGVNAPIDTLFKLDDMGELAARLGSVDVYDRRGDTVFSDNCNGSIIKLSTFHSGAGSSFASSAERSLHGDNSYKLIAGSDLVQNSGFQLGLPLLRESGVSLEVAFSEGSDYDRLQMELLWIKESTYKISVLKYEKATKQVTVQNSVGGWDILPTTIETLAGEGGYNVLKLVINPTVTNYIRAMLNNKEWDLGDIGMMTAGGSFAPCFLVTFALYGRASFNDYIYVEHIIVKQNEP